MNNTGVIQLIDSLDTGGAEVLSVNIANLLKENNLNSHICVTRKEGKLKENINSKVGYLFLNRKKTIDIRAIIILKKYIKENRIKIIHAHSSSIFTAFFIKLIYFKVSIIWHDHYGKSQDLEKRSFVFLKIISFFMDSIISVNSDLQKWAVNKLYCKKVFFLNNFPSFSNFNKETFLKGEKGKRIVHLAAFREQKDHETLIKSFQFFLENNNDWSLHLVGNIHKDNYAAKILDLIEAKELKKHIFVYGARLDIKHILKQATIGVLSSKSEGLPIALLEYGLASLPVIVTDVGECANVVQHNKTGEVVAPQNVLLLSNSIKKLVKNTEKRTIFAKEFHKCIIENYSDSKFIQELLKIYNI